MTAAIASFKAAIGDADNGTVIGSQSTGFRQVTWDDVVGLNPTDGRVSRFGVLAMADSLDHVGPMARSVADVAIMFDAIAGRDPKDPTSLEAPDHRSGDESARPTFGAATCAQLFVSCRSAK